MTIANNNTIKKNNKRCGGVGDRNGDGRDVTGKLKRDNAGAGPDREISGPPSFDDPLTYSIT